MDEILDREKKKFKSRKFIALSRLFSNRLRYLRSQSQFSAGLTTLGDYHTLVHQNLISSVASKRPACEVELPLPDEVIEVMNKIRDNANAGILTNKLPLYSGLK